MLALLREKIVRTVYGDDVPPLVIHRATFDIFGDQVDANIARRLLYSGLTLMQRGITGCELVKNNDDRAESLPMAYAEAALKAFGEIKW